jgi:hypothetical protein
MEAFERFVVASGALGRYKVVSRKQARGIDGMAESLFVKVCAFAQAYRSAYPGAGARRQPEADVITGTLRQSGAAYDFWVMPQSWGSETAVFELTMLKPDKLSPTQEAALLLLGGAFEAWGVLDAARQGLSFLAQHEFDKLVLAGPERHRQGEIFHPGCPSRTILMDADLLRLLAE